MTKKKAQTDGKLLRENRDQVAKALEILFADGYMDRKKLYLENFLRGMAFSAGGIIGATLIIAVLVWILSLFDSIPLVGPFFDETKQTIQDGTNGR